VWIDAQMPPSLARRLAREFGLDAVHVDDLGLRMATDSTIFTAARAAQVIVVTKDTDFVQLLERHGPPPQVLWVTCGNITNARLWDLFRAAWPEAAKLFAAGEALVELSERGFL
jgi:predicted nuclease of predicted toxin-antitoxin system